jgi:hypothetical protein
MARSQAGRKGRAKGGNAKASSAYKVYTRPDLYEQDRPFATWLVRIAIVVSMVGIGAVFRQPLHEMVAAVLGRVSG